MNRSIMSATEHVNGIISMDHPVVAVEDMQASYLTYQKLGFTIPPRGSHVEWGTGNWCIMFPYDYLELRGIIDASRFIMNLDTHLERYGEGLMGVALGTDNAKQSLENMLSNGIRVGELRRLTRNFELEDGWTHPSFELSVPEADDIEGLMHVVVLEHLTPELIRSPKYLQHPNTCIGVNSMTGVIDDVDRVARKMVRLLGEQAVAVGDDGIRLTLPTGQQIELLKPEHYRESYGEDGRPRLGAMTLRVTDLATSRQVLTTNGVPYCEPGIGVVRISPQDTCGVIMDFTEAAPG